MDNDAGKEYYHFLQRIYVRIREYSELFLSIALPVHGQFSKTPLICYPLRRTEWMQTMKFTWQIYFDDLT